MAGSGDALLVGLGRAALPAVAQRLAADGYRVLALREADEAPGAFDDIAALLHARAPGFRPDAVVIAAAAPAPAPGGVDAVAVAALMDALDGTLATAGLVAKSLFAAAPPHPARAVVMLDWAVTSTPGRTAASAVMGGLLGLARSWALEFAPRGVTTNAVVVGPDVDGARDPAEEAWLVRRPTADDAAHAVAFFLDPRSSAITGQVLLVCGGRTAGRLTI
ncbi:MAG: SDR family oxidoreductase [Alphaproteobacteria bacterium]|nr:SDR family oxidoreductase [Alphaproteobacteria bacterium]